MQIKKLSLDLFTQSGYDRFCFRFYSINISNLNSEIEKTGEIMLGDSIGPDEFRIWNKGDYQVGQIQDSYDKT